MDKRIRNFLAFSFLFLLIFILSIAVFYYIYKHFTLVIYSRVLLMLIFLVCIIIVLIAYSMLAVLYAYTKRHVSPSMFVPVRLGLKIIIPFTISIAGLLKKDKDEIRSLFIDMNNIIVESGKRLYKPEQVLVILPHCLQNSACGHKVTGEAINCMECGKCTIGSILGVVREMGVKAIIVTGGTAARNIVAKEKPGIILSVACERDLAVGIADISRIPVLGVVNERPNGPCKDTCVDVGLLKKKLEGLLGKAGEVCK